MPAATGTSGPARRLAAPGKVLLTAAFACVTFISIGQARADAPRPEAESGVRHVSYTTGQQGSRLKWLPHRPQDAIAETGTATRAVHEEVGPTRGAEHVAARLAQSGGAPTDPFRDPFQEGPQRLRLPAPLDRYPTDPTRLMPPEPAEAEALPTEPRPVEPQPLEPRPRDRLPEPADEPYALPGPGVPGLMPEEPLDLNGAMARENGSGWSVRGDELKFDCPSPTDKEYYRPIRDVTTDLTPPKAAELPLPPECGLDDESFDPNVPRAWAPMTFTWKASGLCHKPLYFEQVHAERYGHCRGPVLQPVLSHAHFFLTVPVLPYKMGLTPPKECMYTLGYYRPGSCAPYMLDPLPLSVRAGLFQAGAWVGGVFILP